MTSVDPRIEDRRSAVRRQRHRTLLIRLGLVGAVAAIVAVGFAVTRSPVLDVDRVTIEGSDQVDSDSVVAASGVVLGDPMTDVDVAGAETDLEALPWVATAEVGREWPSTVTVEITERTPVAVLPVGDDGFLAVDVEGRVLQALDEPGSLLPLVGVEPADLGEFIDAGALLEIAGALPVGLSNRVSGAAGDVSNIELSLRPAGTVRFGGASEIGAKFLALRTLLAQVDQRCLADIDLRVALRPTITRDSACSSPAEPIAADSDGESTGDGSVTPAGDGAGTDTHTSVQPSQGSDPVADGSLSESAFPVHPVTGLPYDPAVGMQWDPVTGQPVDPSTGAGYDPPPLG